MNRRGTAAVLLLAIALAGCGEAGQARPPAPTREAGALPVQLVRVETGSISSGWTGNATLRARDDAEVAARVGGPVSEVLVDVGDRVRQGQPLARIDRQRLQLEAERARAIHQQRKAEAERSAQLRERQLVSQQEHEQAVSDQATARSELALAELTVREATVTAPFDGVVAARYLSRGNTIAAGEPAFRILSADRLEAQLAVPERDIATLAVGQPARLAADALPGLDIGAEIARIAPAVDGDSGTVAVMLRVIDGDPRLAPGMFVRARIITETRPQVLLLPAEAVVREDGVDSVFVAEVDAEGQLRAQRVVVQTGLSEGGRIEIRSGIDADAAVVRDAGGGLRDGVRLEDVAGLLAAPASASGPSPASSPAPSPQPATAAADG